MRPDSPLLARLTEKEIRIVETLLSGPGLFNGHTRDVEQGILQKTNTRSLDELVSRLHCEVILAEVSDESKENSVVHFLKDPRFERFQVFADTAIRILDNSTHQYLYVNEATESISGWSAEEIRKGGLLFGHRKTHPWDLLQVVLLSARALRIWEKLSDDDKLNSRLSYDLRVRNKEGKYRRIQQHVFTLSISPSGKPGLLMIISNDITAFKTGTKIQYVIGVTRGNRFDVLLRKETRPESSPLSEREAEIVNLISCGHTENAIAEMLAISFQTVKSHRKNILTKTQCKNTAELIRKAMIEGWI